MITIERRSQHERDNFIAIVGMDIDSMPLRVFIQSDVIEGDYNPSEDGRLIIIYSDYINSSVRAKLPEVEPLEQETITLPFSYVDVCYDNIYPISYCIKKKYYTGDQIVACVDIFGNVHFPDFIHDSRGKDFVPIFYEVLRLEGLIKEDFAIQTKIENYLKNKIIASYMDVIKEFDIIKIAKEVAMEAVNSLHNMQVQALNSQIESLKKEVNKKIKEKAWEYIKAGIKLTKEGWQITDGRISYRKRITAKRIKYTDKIVEAPPGKFYISGLYISIEDGELRVRSKKSHHPNADSNMDGRVCIGDYEEKGILLESPEKIADLPALLETVNIDSAYEIDATNEAQRIWRDKVSNNEVLSEVFDFCIESD